MTNNRFEPVGDTQAKKKNVKDGEQQYWIELSRFPNLQFQFLFFKIEIFR